MELHDFKNFPQLSLIFNFLANSCSFSWDNNKWVTASPYEKGYWVDKYFSIFVDDWRNAIIKLPKFYNHEIKVKTFIEHALKSNIFCFNALLKARFSGAYNFRLFRKYKMVLLRHCIPSFVLVCIALFPKVLLHAYFLLKLSKNLSNKYSKYIT